MGELSERDKGGGGLRLLDTALVAAAVVGGILVLLWVFRVVLGLALFAVKVVVLVVVVAALVRLAHRAGRRRG